MGLWGVTIHSVAPTLWLCRFERSMHIVKENLGPLKLHYHIRILGMVWIDKRECHWHQIRSRTSNLWSKIHFGLGWITPNLFKNLDMSTQIEHEYLD